MQKFRIDFNGSRKLRMSDESKFTFKIPRYGDLVMDSYLAVTLPHIWSPLFPVEDNIHSTTCGESEFNDEIIAKLPGGAPGKILSFLKEI